MAVRTELLQARCTFSELRVFLRIAEQENATQSETLRRIVRDEARRRGLWPPGGQPQDERDQANHVCSGD